LDKNRYSAGIVAKQRVSYAWARLTAAANRKSHQLSDEAEQGLHYARDLADDAKLRSEHALRGGQPYPPLTIAEVADREQLSPSTISARMRRARRELFGNLTDSAIYKRRQRARQRPLNPRTCQEPDCTRELPRHAARQRRYCDEHRTARARVQRHRNRTKPPDATI
jgi:hypothetical protein